MVASTTISTNWQLWTPTANCKEKNITPTRSPWQNFHGSRAFMCLFLFIKHHFEVKKSLLQHCEMHGYNFFVAPLLSITWCKRNAAVKCCNRCCQLMSKVGQANFKGLSYRMGNGRILLKISALHSSMTTCRVTLLSARLISMDSTFNNKL